METYMNQTTGNVREILRMGKTTIWGLGLLLVVLLSGCSTPTVAQKVAVSINVNLPSWAPYYDNANLVRYYYFPDIECYYDVMNREFIYMEDGEWMFGRSLPPVYRWFDLDNCFIVALNSRVYEPWRHFNYYVSHYPRYYYRTVYRDRYRDRNRPLRGFNENERDVVYNRRSDRENNSFERRNEERREDNNRFENREENMVRRNFPERRVEPSRSAQPVQYYGKDVGRPVRVQRNMKRADDIKIRENKEVKREKEGRQR